MFGLLLAQCSAFWEMSHACELLTWPIQNDLGTTFKSYSKYSMMADSKSKSLKLL